MGNGYLPFGEEIPYASLLPDFDYWPMH